MGGIRHNLRICQDGFGNKPIQGCSREFRNGLGLVKVSVRVGEYKSKLRTGSGARGSGRQWAGMDKGNDCSFTSVMCRQERPGT